jgi:hypothetical protein
MTATKFLWQCSPWTTTASKLSMEGDSHQDFHDFCWRFYYDSVLMCDCHIAVLICDLRLLSVIDVALLLLINSGD